MLRIATKRAIQQIRHESGAPVSAPPPAGIGKRLLGTTLFFGAGTSIGVVGYALVNPEFRQQVEDIAPPTKELFKAIIGPAELTHPVQIPAPKIQQKSPQEEQRKIEEQQRQVEERKRLEQQRSLDERAKLSLVDAELRRAREIQNAELEERVRDYRQNLDVQYESRIRQTEALHADNLERVVKTLKQVHDAEAERAVEEAVSKERRLHSKQVGVALEKLRGMEVALEGRAGLDAESRRAKHFWLACQNLLESITYGQKSGSNYEQRRKPLGNEINVIATACENDQFVTSVAQHFPDSALKSGVYTEQDLKNRFKKIYKLASRTANVDETNASLVKYVSSWIQSLFIIDLPRSHSSEDTIKLSKLDNREIISRARYFVEKGDFLSAVRLTQLLRGQPAGLAQDWIKDARAYLEARFLADILLAHSAASSIRSIY